MSSTPQKKKMLINYLKYLICNPGLLSVTCSSHSAIHVNNTCLVATFTHLKQTNSCHHSTISDQPADQSEEGGILGGALKGKEA